MDWLLREHRPVLDLARRFLEREVMPYEPVIMERESQGLGRLLAAEEIVQLDRKAEEYGLRGIDTPESLGGFGLPAGVSIALWEILGQSAVFYLFPPDSSNLQMLLSLADSEQFKRYVEPLSRNELKMSIAVSEPEAGSDPSAMRTRAVRRGSDWVLSGQKTWISNVPAADIVIVMARTGTQEEGSKGISAFILDREIAQRTISRKIPMIGGWYTYELTFDQYVLPAAQLLGPVGGAFAAMASRLSHKRLQLAAWALGMAQRALRMMIEHVQQRRVFGELLADRQSIQWWIADSTTKIHAARLMLYDAAYKIQEGRDPRVEASMVKVYAAEAAGEVLDHAMQAFGASGLSKELPLSLMADTVRWIRVGEGPSEVHRMVIARKVMRSDFFAPR
ncbi:MAG: acyl-CoA dehydrogenase family protein [Lautropia sp.]